MSKTKVNAVPGTDPTLPSIEMKLGKETYYLAFTFKALAIAEKRMRDLGVPCNLLLALDFTSLDAGRVVPMLYAALITHHPDISPQTVLSMVTMKNAWPIIQKVAEAYNASMAEPTADEEKADPTPAE